MPAEGLPIMLKFRSVMQPAPATLHQDGNTIRIHLPQPQYGISPGQAAVFYDDTRVLGGGWITGTDRV